MSASRDDMHRIFVKYFAFEFLFELAGCVHRLAQSSQASSWAAELLVAARVGAFGDNAAFPNEQNVLAKSPIRSITSYRGDHLSRAMPNLIAAATSSAYGERMNSSTEPSDDRIPLILARVNAGLAKEWSQIGELVEALKRMLKEARAMGDPTSRASNVPDGNARGAICRPRSRRTVRPMRRRKSVSRRRTRRPIRWSRGRKCWPANPNSKRHGTKFARFDNQCLPASQRAVWDDLCQSIEQRVTTIEAHALAIRFQLELRAKYDGEKATALTKDVAAHLPKGADNEDAKKYSAQYRKAWQDFEKEKETVSGPLDVLKALMMVPPKPPAERVANERSQHLQTPPAN